MKKETIVKNIAKAQADTYQYLSTLVQTVNLYIPIEGNSCHVSQIVNGNVHYLNNKTARRESIHIDNMNPKEMMFLICSI